MTKEEEALNRAINIVRYFEAHFAKSKGEKEYAANLIEALEQEFCDDAISRKVVLDEMYKRKADGDAITAGFIKNLPPVTSKIKIGRWIRWYDHREDDSFIENIPHCKCSECEFEVDTYSSHFMKYCSNCGAKMAESEMEE